MPPPDWNPKQRWRWKFHGARTDNSQTLVWTREPAPTAYTNTLGFDAKLKHAHDSFSASLVPLSCFPLIGAVALQWGGLEVWMNDLLTLFVMADGDPDDQGWERRNFSKRKELLKKKALARFPGPIAEEIVTVLEAAAVYQWQRNLLVHGHIHFDTNEGTRGSYAAGIVNKRYVALPVKDDHLFRMYHEISYLTARLALLTSDSPTGGYWLPLKDRLTLRAFAERHRSIPPTPQMIAPQHPPSRMTRHPKDRKGK